jgi:phosphate starvation-inducible PhoH-like protein
MGKKVVEEKIKKTFSIQDLKKINPINKKQEDLYQNFLNTDNNIFLYGSAGTGKTFCALYLSLCELFARKEYEKIIIIRSIVSSRDIGFLPGTLEEKIEVYEEPYRQILNKFFTFSNSYSNLKEINKIEFLPSSFLRGTTFDNSIVIVDEIQNMTFEELDTIITRVGKNTKIIFSGDIKQNDLYRKNNDKSGFEKFFDILTKTKLKKYFYSVEFTHKDIVRSGLVKEYIIAKETYDERITKRFPVAE